MLLQEAEADSSSIMINITDKCTGCRACEQLCPHTAIDFRQDDEGFWTPIINQSLCVDCGLCAAKCPQNRQVNSNLPVATKAARLKDDSILFKSASGGAFAGIALYAIRQGWVVYGVRYDEKLVAHHGKAETVEELLSLLSSKYVQSDTRHTFSEVKKLLREGQNVLYSGTGCQIAGLKTFLGKEYDNLITIDLICHGVPSPLLFEKYIQYLSIKHGGERIRMFDFRDKKIGWGLDFKYIHNVKTVVNSCSASPYYTNFLKGTIYRECCYTCKYASKKRVADITIGDYWGIEYAHPEFEDNRGVSVVLLNSDKGARLWTLCKDDFESIDSDVDLAAKYNGNLIHPTKRDDTVRDHIYDEIWGTDSVDFIKKLPYKRTIRAIVKSILPIWALRMVRSI